MERRQPWVRVGVLAVVLLGLLLAGKLSGVTDGWTLADVRGRIQAAGALGLLVYLALFTVGELLQVPGMVFVGAALLAWGRVAGFGAALLGALVSLSVTFFLVRAIGGRPLAGLERPLFKKLLARLEQRPVATVALLRVVLWLGAPLNYALALSPISYRSYLLGSFLGLLPPLLVAAVIVERLFA